MKFLLKFLFVMLWIIPLRAQTTTFYIFLDTIGEKAALVQDSAAYPTGSISLRESSHYSGLFYKANIPFGVYDIFTSDTLHSKGYEIGSPYSTSSIRMFGLQIDSISGDLIINKTLISQNSSAIILNAESFAELVDSTSAHRTELGILTDSAYLFSQRIDSTNLRVDTSRAELAINATNINLRVEKDDIINQINISNEGVDIAGSRITLDGDVGIAGNFTLDNGVVKSSNWSATEGSYFDLTNGTLILGGSAGDNVTLQTIAGGGQLLIGNSTNWIAVGKSGVSTGIINANNDYWFTNGNFNFGGANGIKYNGSTISLGSNVLIESSNWTSTAGSRLDLTNGKMWIGGSSVNGVYIDGSVTNGQVRVANGSDWSAFGYNDSYSGLIYSNGDKWLTDGNFQLGGTSGIGYNGSKISLKSDVEISGDVKINSGSLYSSNYSAEHLTGWKIDNIGNADFNDVTVRGILYAESGTDIDWNYVTNVSIDSADITNLSATSIRSGTMSAGSIDIGSGNFKVNSSGDLTAANANVTGCFTSYSSGQAASVNISNSDINFYASGIGSNIISTYEDEFGELVISVSEFNADNYSVCGANLNLKTTNPIINNPTYYGFNASNTLGYHALPSGASNYYVNNLTFSSNGVLTLGRTSPLSNLTVNLDGRYSLINHTHSNYITDGNTGWDNSYGFSTTSWVNANFNNGTDNYFTLGATAGGNANVSTYSGTPGAFTIAGASGITTTMNSAGPAITVALNSTTQTNIANGATAYGWGNHASAGYITDGNSGWNNSYGFITDGNTNWNNSYGFITDGNTGWDNSYGFSTTSWVEANFNNGINNNFTLGATTGGSAGVSTYSGTPGHFIIAGASGITTTMNSAGPAITVALNSATQTNVANGAIAYSWGPHTSVGYSKIQHFSGGAASTPYSQPQSGMSAGDTWDNDVDDVYIYTSNGTWVKID